MLILPKFFGIDGVWLSVVVAEFLAAILGAAFLVGKRGKYHYF